jgi:magnesium-transporting ATPase (P-type)
VAAPPACVQMEERETLLSKFVDQLRQPLILLLFGSAAVSAALGSYDDAISITLVRRPTVAPAHPPWGADCVCAYVCLCLSLSLSV